MPPKRAISRATTALIGAQDLPKLFWVEPHAQRGEADQIDEHHGELPALPDRPLASAEARDGAPAGRASLSAIA